MSEILIKNNVNKVEIPNIDSTSLTKMTQQLNFNFVGISKMDTASCGVELLLKLKSLSSESFRDLLDKEFDTTIKAILGLSYLKDNDGKAVWKVKSDLLAKFINTLSEEERVNLFQLVLANKKLLGINSLKELKELKNNEINIPYSGSKNSLVKELPLEIVKLNEDKGFIASSISGSYNYEDIFEKRDSIINFQAMLDEYGFNIENPKIRSLLDKVVFTDEKDENLFLTIGDVIAINSYGENYNPEISNISSDEKEYVEKYEFYQKVNSYKDAYIKKQVDRYIKEFLGYDKDLAAKPKKIKDEIKDESTSTVVEIKTTSTEF